MNGLQLGTSEAGDVVLPIEAATTVIAIVGTRGAGKTETGTVLCEELYDAGVPWVAIDPLGVMHGLRSSFDGKSAGLAVSILGGAHGDVPLQPTAGAAVADLVVDRPGHYVLDLSDFDTDAENDRFAEQFAHRLIRAKARAPFAMHLIVDEADTFIPQQPFPGQQRMLGAFNALAKRARVRGVGMTLMTQRPASLNKNTLSMAECLVAMKLMSPQDQGAVEDYVKRHLGASERQAFMKALPSFSVGQAWLWAPHWREGPERIQVRRRRTFDSSATPKAGERPIEPTVLAAVDIEALRAAMASTVEEAEASDPKALRVRVSELERELIHARLAPVPPALDAEYQRLQNEYRLRGQELESTRGQVLLLRGALAYIRTQANEALEEIHDDDARPAGGLGGDGRAEGTGAEPRGAGSSARQKGRRSTAGTPPAGERNTKADGRVPGVVRARQLEGGRPGVTPVGQPARRRTEDMTDEELKALVDAKIAAAVAKIPGARVEVLPAEFIRHEYQRRTVERVMERVGALKEDEREAVRFMLGQGDRLVSNADISKALSGYQGGAAQVKWGTAVKGLMSAGVVSTIERQGSKPRIREWVEDALGPHSPTEAEVDEVYQAVLGRIAGAAS